MQRYRSWGILGALLIAAELGLRAAGYGDPDLVILDDRMEYRGAPNGGYAPFGARVTYNSFSMRGSSEPSGRSLKVLTIGDSILHGGEAVSDAELAAALLQDRLSKRLGGSVWVGNVAAGSWGPANQRAYLEVFGAFGAQAALVVWNAGDLQDLPHPEGALGGNHRTRAPLLALEDAAYLHLWKRFIPKARPQNNAEQGVQEVKALLEWLIERNIAPLVVFHPPRQGAPLAAEAFKMLAHDYGAPFLQLQYPQGAYQADGLHLTAQGQIALAAQLDEALRQNGY